jgi:putative toxin-antitoxin system antitoxin component (TIGR02293 family)
MAQAHSAVTQIESEASAQWERKRRIRSGATNAGRSGAVRNLVGLSLKAHRGIPKAEASQLFQRIAATSSLPLGTLRAELIPDSSWKRAGQRLGPQASQTAVRLMHILSLAERVWGNETDATEWLNGPHMELRGATPLSLLKTEAGGRAVEALLGALEFGFPV